VPLAFAARNPSGDFLLRMLVDSHMWRTPCPRVARQVHFVTTRLNEVTL
jgi:hypothetical protein